VPEELRQAWREAAEASLRQSPPPPPSPPRAVTGWPAQFVILVTCRDERQQVELLERFHTEGLECRAILS
jgi:hypothetical protein